MMYGFDAGWGLLMMLFWVGLIVLIAVLVLRGSHAQNHGTMNQDDALTIAKARYAKGEINKDEFDQLKQDLLSK